LVNDQTAAGWLAGDGQRGPVDVTDVPEPSTILLC
jgi:hypothetical protein